MQTVKDHESGVGTIEIALVVTVLILLGAVGWFIHQRQTTPSGTPPSATHTTRPPSITTDPTANWKRVQSIGGAYSIKVPDGWKLALYPDNVMNSDSITFSEGKPAVISTGTAPYAGDQRRFNVGFSENQNEDEAPQWQSPNPYGTETKTDFSIGNIKGTRYTIEFTQTVTGVTKGDKIYQYAFTSGSKHLGVVYIQYASDADNLKTVEQAIKTIVIN